MRVLARAWLYVIWRCWQDATRYDPDQHRALQRVLDSERSGDDKPTDAKEAGGAARAPNENPRLSLAAVGATAILPG